MRNSIVVFVLVFIVFLPSCKHKSASKQVIEDTENTLQTMLLNQEATEWASNSNCCTLAQIIKNMDNEYHGVQLSKRSYKEYPIDFENGLTATLVDDESNGCVADLELIEKYTVKSPDQINEPAVRSLVKHGIRALGIRSSAIATISFDLDRYTENRPKANTPKTFLFVLDEILELHVEMKDKSTWYYREDFRDNRKRQYGKVYEKKDKLGRILVKEYYEPLETTKKGYYWKLVQTEKYTYEPEQ